MKAPDALTGGRYLDCRCRPQCARASRATAATAGRCSTPAASGYWRSGEAEVLEIPLAGGPARRLASAAGITKLIGFDRARRARCWCCARNRTREIAVLIARRWPGDGHRLRSAIERGRHLSRASARGGTAYGDTVLYVRKETRNEVTGDVLEWTGRVRQGKATNGRGISASARARIAASRHCRRMPTGSLTCGARESGGSDPAHRRSYRHAIRR